MNKQLYAEFNLAPINLNCINAWKHEFLKYPKNILAQNVCNNMDPYEASISKPLLEDISQEYQYKVEPVARPIADQNETDLGWIYAALNAMRLPFMKHYNIEEFEFSQAYLLYWHTLESCHNYINSVINMIKYGEYVTGHNFSYLLENPIQTQGGQWDVISNLIKQYGIMPKSCFVGSFSAENNANMNSLLSSHLREIAKHIIEAMHQNMPVIDLKTLISELMLQIYNIIGICLGIPNITFVWEYYDQDAVFHSTGPITPIEFYEDYVKKCYNVVDKVCLVNDPRDTVDFQKLYTIAYLENIIGGPRVLYNNQPIELLLDLVVKSVINGDAVWIRCDATKHSSEKLGILDMNIHDFNTIFGLNDNLALNKCDRLLFYNSKKSHAMLITGVSLDQNGMATKFRVENSKGVHSGVNGHMHMSAEWFNEFTYEIVVDRKLVPEKVLKVFEMKPIVLPIWDKIR